MDYDEACFMHLTPGVIHNFPKAVGVWISPHAQKDPRFLFEKRRGQSRESWSLVPTKDGSTLPQDCVEYCYAEHEVTGKTYNKKK